MLFDTLATASQSLPVPLASTPIFVVGAGGIGCELLKNLVLMGFRTIELIDLDTIDASNLNRQFLFREHHVGRSKAEVAAEVLRQWEPTLKIKAYHGNVKSANFDVNFYKKFKLVLNGLDNMSARKHVNRMCMQAGIPLVESGTMGYNGQVQPILKGRFQCYDCLPKQADQKTFAVCTIHARPTTMVHCVHYAKEFYARLFGDSVAGSSAGAGEDEGDDEVPKKKAPVGEMGFLDSLIEEYRRKKHPRTNDDSPAETSENSSSESALAWDILELLYHTKIQELLAMKTEWTIQSPEPIQVQAIRSHPTNFHSAQGLALELSFNEEVPTVEKCCAYFVRAVQLCLERGRKPFDKDDAISVYLIAACANLRATCFHIKPQSVSDIRTIAGSIVPAIASTNAVIAGVVVAQAVRILQLGAASNEGEGSIPSERCRHVFLQQVPQVRKRDILSAVPSTSGGFGEYRVSGKGRDGYLMTSIAPAAPVQGCFICSNLMQSMTIRLNAGSHTLGTFVELVLIQHLGFVCPTISDTNTGNILYEKDDFEELSGKPLNHWMKASASAAADGGTELSASRSCGWTIGDLYQEVEWETSVVDCPLAFADETEFEITRSGSSSGSGDENEARGVGVGKSDSATAPRSAAPIPDQAGGRGSLVAATDPEDEVVMYHPRTAHTAEGQGQAHTGAAPPPKRPRTDPASDRRQENIHAEEDEVIIV
jgi:ubiquitin-like 1-activating enzyme E1 B